MSTEVLVLIVVAGGIYFSHAGAFTSLLISSANTSDAFKFINEHSNLNQKLVDMARLSETGDSALPRILAFASASDLEQTEEKETKAAETTILTTADNSAIVKPNYTVPAVIEGNLAVYKVAEGDNPTIIASRYGIGLPSLLRANNMNDASMIKPGQELKVPLCDGILYNLKDTDTVDSVMKQFKLSEEDIDELLNCNDVETFEDLYAMQVTLVPQRDLSIPTAPKPTLVKSVKTNTSGRVATTTASAPSSFAGGSGSLLWPVPESRVITQGYSWRHNGLDISGQRQDPGPNIIASDECFVEVAGWEAGGWGNTVVCNHGSGLKTRYAHMSVISVKAGDTVAKGDTLGRIGNTGRSTGPHLHFTVYANGKSVNPNSYLAR